MRKKRQICDRNGCDETAIQLLKWDFYTETTKACGSHARWWKLRSVHQCHVTPLESAAVSR